MTIRCLILQQFYFDILYKPRSHMAVPDGNSQAQLELYRFGHLGKYMFSKELWFVSCKNCLAQDVVHMLF